MMRSPTDAASAPFQALTNPRYELVVTPTGGGFSAYDGWLLTAWRADPIEGFGGVLVYLRDLDSGEYWTASGRALPGQSLGRIEYGADAVSIVRSHVELDSQVEVRLHPGVGLEQRRCVIDNKSARRRRIEITSYVEVVLNYPAAHAGHPAFSKLFIQTTVRDNGATLIATRRPREADEIVPAFVHALFDAPTTDFCTDRPSFIGRGRDLDRPHALADVSSLGQRIGNVLDPALAIRTVIDVEPGRSREVRFVLAAGYSLDVLLQFVATLRVSTLGAIIGSEAYGATSLIAELTGGIAAITASHNPPRAPRPAEGDDEAKRPKPRRQYFNGYGGFSADGREYVIDIANDAVGSPRLPPAPWTNVIANPGFGCIVSETGAGMAWSGNSREHRLTPWSNDPVVDPHGDAIYIRDEESKAFWSPQAGPAPAAATFEVRHGFGYSSWQHVSNGLDQTVTVFVPSSDRLRLTRVRIWNRSGRARRIALFAYNRWVLGGSPEATLSSIRAAFNSDLQAIIAQRDSPGEGAGAVAFAAADCAPLAGWCTDRGAFLGMPGSVAAPVALLGDGLLSEADGDQPCAVLRVIVDLPTDETREVTFLLGETDGIGNLAHLLAKYRSAGQIEHSFNEVRTRWSQLLDRLQVKTPSAALDLMVNGWLPYQNIACRLWARSAFYQSGGAFGFRDQIQDAAALIYLRPELTRAQILLHAAHQFVEGDVLHWWHPPDNRGLRTRFADDLLWLPFVAAHYVKVTGDRSLLDEPVPFVHARSLEPGEGEVLLETTATEVTASLYEHCWRAIERSFALGAHGLPFFGVGDWNDGMNRVGQEGRGESVWMGFFLFAVLGDFLPVLELRGDHERASRCRAHRSLLLQALNADGWDGAWYRRGWYDDGAPLGSASSDECRIDALAQAWAVISGAATVARANSALDAVETHLVDDAQRLIRLFTPPFVDTPHDPGYIKGYVAGVRENGGQYTHAATWVVRAMAEAGRRDRAMSLMEALNPIHHSLDRTAADRYKVEPYVVAADIYGAPPHVGRGGWTWYTGSAGWMYRVAVETLLGFGVENGDTLCLRPRIPDHWPSYQIVHKRPDGTRLTLDVVNPQGRATRVVTATLDGVAVAVQDGALRLTLPKSGRAHRIVAILGE